MYSLAERNQFHHTADNTVHICKFLQDLCHSGPIHSPVQFTVLLDIPCDQGIVEDKVHLILVEGGTAIRRRYVAGTNVIVQ